MEQCRIAMLPEHCPPHQTESAVRREVITVEIMATLKELDSGMIEESNISLETSLPKVLKTDNTCWSF